MDRELPPLVYSSASLEVLSANNCSLAVLRPFHSSNISFLGLNDNNITMVLPGALSLPKLDFLGMRNSRANCTAVALQEGLPFKNATCSCGRPGLSQRLVEGKVCFRQKKKKKQTNKQTNKTKKLSSSGILAFCERSIR